MGVCAGRKRYGEKKLYWVLGGGASGSGREVGSGGSGGGGGGGGGGGVGGGGREGKQQWVG